jgi:hypothetical protein
MGLLYDLARIATPHGNLDDCDREKQRPRVQSRTHGLVFWLNEILGNRGCATTIGEYGIQVQVAHLKPPQGINNCMILWSA